MGIAQKLSRAFRDSTRVRGQAYFSEGRVIITAEGQIGGEVRARVRGQDQDWYRVRLKMRGSRLHASCTCPFFKPQGKPCKHLWATILAADARSLLPPPPPSRPVKLVTHVPTVDPTTTTPGPHTIIGANPSPQSQPPRTRRPPPREPHSNNNNGPNQRRGPYPPAPYGAGPYPAGQGAVQGRRKGAREGQVRPARNSKRFLQFILDAPASSSQNQLVVEMARRQRRKSGDWGPLQPWWPPHQQVGAKAND